MSKDKITACDDYLDLMADELAVLQKIDHPNITRVFETMECPKNYYIVMEFISGGDLLGKVAKMDHFSEDHACQIVHQILLALNYMHEIKIVHRDLKPDNLLCIDCDDGELIIKLTDFGFATAFDDDKFDLCLGTPEYMAPELLMMNEYCSKVDVWSLGVITYMLLSGQKPYIGSSIDELKEMIVR